ncbi:MAG TPA: phosphoglycerate kinase [Candidatus Saccharimonadales bacterium]|nr:phosphoglycerate kinase [Candidatus Saccharimonadales bacterium]
MAFSKQTIKDYDVIGKQVLLRADYNVPIDSMGKITDDFRIRKSIPTIKYLLDNKCSIVICSHLGRPDGKNNKKLSLRPVAKRLSKLLDRPLEFSDECIGVSAEAARDKLKPGQILVLENLRFHSEEEANDKTFSKQLAYKSNVFVQDGFGVVHRAHASTVGVTKFLPSIAGLLLFDEVNTLSEVMINPSRPLVTIVGGAKIADKIDILKRFISVSDIVIVGGAMANTFIMAKGIDVGGSLVDKNELGLASEIIDLAQEKMKISKSVFYIPQDGVVADSLSKPSYTRIVDWDSHVVADIEAYPKQPKVYSYTIKADEQILDIGPFSGAFIAGSIQLASTVLWNGPLGVTETKALIGPVGPFAHGTDLVIEALLGQFGAKPYSIIGGGDTVGYIEGLKLEDSFGHVSTGGGASLDLLSGRKLPGVEALLNLSHQK